MRESGWALFDLIVREAPQRHANPWTVKGDAQVFEPDFDTLALLLGVPAHLQAPTQSGIPALALDVWVSYEMRRAGFHPDRVWPRPEPPRVLPGEVFEFVNKLPVADRKRLQATISTKGTGGTASANLLGKNYVKQVDVVMSSWATGPELLVSTKRMDSSFGKNAANRVEESYGDAKNLRLRYPQAALGFVFALSARALTAEPDTAAWIVDLLGKLGREDDAYDAVALVLPDLTPEQETGSDEEEPAGPLVAGTIDEFPGEAVASPLEAVLAPPTLEAEARAALGQLPPVRLRHEEVPTELDPGRFFAIMCNRILDNSPVNFHKEARALRAEPRR